jgi:hypothetical protein
VGWIGDHTPLSTHARALLTVCNMLERGRAPGSACCFGAYPIPTCNFSRACRACWRKALRRAATSAQHQPRDGQHRGRTGFCAARARRVPRAAGVRKHRYSCNATACPVGQLAADKVVG